MIKPTIVGVYCAALLALSAWTLIHAQEKASHGNISAEDAVMVSVTAKVEALDLEKREITLKGPLGDVTTLTVEKSVKRLNEIKPGDEVTAKYYLSVAGEVREPTEKEKENPIMVAEGSAKAPKDVSPAADGVRVIRAVATVEGLERPTRKLTLKGPRGNYITVRARDLERLEKLHLGDTIVVTFTEALAMSVEKTK